MKDILKRLRIKAEEYEYNDRPKTAALYREAANRIMELEDALVPFAEMARASDNEEATEIVVQRGVASDMTVIKNKDWWYAKTILDKGR